MEILNAKSWKHEKLRAVIFDFDGTISTLRHGWEQVLRPLMFEMINPDGNDIELEKKVDRYIDESTGIQTIYQKVFWISAVQAILFYQLFHVLSLPEQNGKKQGKLLHWLQRSQSVKSDRQGQH